MTHFEHHRENGWAVLRPLTTRPRIDRMTSRTPRTTYKGEGICLGAMVRGSALRHSYGGRATIAGQVWAACGVMPRAKGYWWVVDDHGAAWIMHESDMTLVGQCGSVQGDLFAEVQS